MGRAWLDIAGAESGGAGARFELKPGLTMIGGPRGDVPVAASGGDCVHVWSQPPKLVFVGGGDPPRVNGAPALEVALHSGDRVEWRGSSATFHTDEPRLEEIPAAWMNPALGAATSAGAAPAPWRWVK